MDNIDDFTANLEECLKDSVFEENICKKPKRLTKNPGKKRQRKTKEQMKILEKYYELNEDWSNELIELIALETNLKEKQVSKWFWDQKTKKTGSYKKPKKAKKTLKAQRGNKRVKTTDTEQIENFKNISKPVKPKIKPKLTIQSVPQVEYKVEPIKLQKPCFAPKQHEMKNNNNLGIRIPFQKNPHESKVKSPSFPIPKDLPPKEKEMNYFRPEFKKQTNLHVDKMENDSIRSSKNSNKSFGFRERFSKFSKMKNLKIQVNNNFDDNRMDFRAVQSCVYPRDPVIRNEGKELPVPLILSRGHTPEINKLGSGMNIFSFENARSPNPMVPFAPSPNRRPVQYDDRRMGNQMTSDYQMLESHSPYRPGFQFTKQYALSPALNFDSSYRRPGNQNFFFNTAVVNPNSMGMTPEANPFKKDYEKFNPCQPQDYSANKMKTTQYFNFDQNMVHDMRGNNP